MRSETEEAFRAEGREVLAETIVTSLKEAVSSETEQIRILSHIAIELLVFLNGEKDTCKSCSKSCELVSTYVMPPITRFLGDNGSDTERDIIFILVINRALISLRLTCMQKYLVAQHS